MPLRLDSTRGTLVLVFLVALALRWLHLEQTGEDILYRVPILDEQLYYRSAADLAFQGELPLPHWRPPGLTFALALLLRLFGPGPDPARMVQAVLSAASVILVYVMARRFLSPRQSLAAAALLALHGVAIEATYELKSATWELFLNLLALLLMVDAVERGSKARALAAGVTLGLSALFRPVILAFVPVALAWFLWTVRRWTSSGLLLLGLSLPLAPVIWQNNAASRLPVLISTNGGINFFIGNNPEYRRTLTARPGNQWNQRVLGPAMQAGFPQTGPEQDRFYYQEGARFIRQHPVQALGLGLRKAYLFFSGREIPRDTDVYLNRESSPVLRALVFPSWPHVPNGILIPLALVGIASGYRRREVRLLGSFVIVNAILFALYFPASRYRVASIPVFCMLAVMGATWLFRRVREASWSRRLALVMGMVLLTTLLGIPTFETRQDLRAERLYFRGNALVEAGRHAEAFDTYVEAARLDSTDARPWTGMEAIYSKDGRWAEAAEAMRRAIAIGPYSARDRDRLVNLLLTLRDYDAVFQVLEEDLALMQGVPERSAEIHFTLGTVRYRLGAFDAALESLRAASATQKSVFEQRLLAWARPLVESEAPERGEGPERGLFWFGLGRYLGEVPAADPVLHHALDLLAEHPEHRSEVRSYLDRREMH